MRFGALQFMREDVRAFRERNECSSIVPDTITSGVLQIPFDVFEARVLALKAATTLKSDEVDTAYELLRMKVG